MHFKAITIEQVPEGGTRAALGTFSEEELMPGEVTVRVTHSSLNYKDALALTGNAPVVRRFPMIPGIDMAGIVEHSEDPRYANGDAVILTGWGTGETHLGAYAERARVPASWLVPRPPTLTPIEAMAIGTAGFTAMLSVMALERAGLTPLSAPILVTGASGGVGSVAISLLAGAGWTVHASTGRPSEESYLRELGAHEVVARDELTKNARPLGKERWAGGIDTVGSTTLASVLSMTRYGGAVAACGLAGGMDLPGSVAPFILRGVSLIGIDSVMAPTAIRLGAWDRLARAIDRDKLKRMTSTIPLEAAIEAGSQLLSGRSKGRVVVEIQA